MPGKAAHLNGILIAVLAAGIFVKRCQGPAAALLAAYLSSWLLVAQLPQLGLTTFDITHLVSLLELAAIVAALTVVAFGIDARSGVPAKLGRGIYGCMLLVIALAHIRHRDLITSMVPAGIPLAAFWPWFTAAASLAVAISFITGIKAQLGGALIGAIYISWVPIVHLPRALNTPAAIGEWTGGALAITLAGAAWIIAGWDCDKGIEVAPLAPEQKGALH
ncbi:hypothetical protein LZ496_09440 [Sphingomonas sp. NSE70-1]|uniref:Uncharacterized protein n=1 Tax=Sphingomonas caseinilyticus TaxID=2908205 RepID=A0ABT0RVE9_9SPHN|nr:hypothetical protein [Sphingomonas caseinilyticus]MCL6699003.1 hypothetical protein [Sphingomonas caseinilyticus]